MILLVEDQYGHIDLRRHPTLRSFPLKKVSGDLYLWGCPLLRSLPSTLEVGGNLGLDWCPSLTELPTTLRVGGSLYLRSTAVSELPDALEVGWNLYLRGSKIKRVPKSARIDGDVVGLRKQ